MPGEMPLVVRPADGKRQRLVWRIRRGVLAGVVHQIEQDLFDRRDIQRDAYVRKGVRHFNVELHGGGGGALGEAGRQAGYQRADAGMFDACACAATFDAAVGEHVFDQM